MLQIVIVLFIIYVTVTTAIGERKDGYHRDIPTTSFFFGCFFQDLVRGQKLNASK